MTRGRVGLALVLVVALALLTARYVVWPATDAPPRHADAIAVLYGGGGERLDEALDLAEQGVAPVLVVSHGRKGTDLCGREGPYEVVCFEPDPDRTQGEAQAVAELARERGWKSLVVVTSRYHAARARLLFGRCFDGTLNVVGARPDSPGGLPGLGSVVHEWGGFVHALAIARGC
jgi:uncharacterized SAM-binding protein YcdF (DUF218 family)